LTVLIMNFTAIFPFNFTPTAHLVVTFSMALTIWASIIGMGWAKNFEKTIIHLTPIGTPNILINFIVIVELVRTIIRPITLSVRLSANMVAGHLLMSLLSNFSMNSLACSTLSTVPITALIVLEIGVALVQAYVIVTLLLLYQNES
jgi:F-type H+-transporting ATPase subunit a